MSSNVLVRKLRADAAVAVAFGLLLAACESGPRDTNSDGDQGGTNASGAGGSNGGSLATGGVAPQGGAAGTTPTGGASPQGGVAGSTGGTGPEGGVAGSAAMSGASGSAGNVTGGVGGVASGGAGGVSGGSGGNGASAGSGAVGTGGRPTFTGTLKIMPLGDSITQSSCYRARLWQKLQQAGKTNFDFVGTQTSSGCGISGYDAQHEGHGGYLVTNLTGGMLSELRGWIMSNTPDLVLFHFGTNDAWNNIAPATILGSFGTVVDELRARNPNVWVLVAQIIPMNPVNTASCTTCACSACGGRVQTLNSMVPAWAASKSTAQSPVLVVDQWTGYDANADSNGDGVHPSETGGSEKMATRWFNALAPLF